ncbi:MAG: ubiquinol-cytochrome C chaperone family protein [Xanthobacteraceae bacterium]
MILGLFRRTPRESTIACLYGAIVAQARRPAFYRSYCVPDTVNGRFEMIVLHAVLVLGRLDAGDAADRQLGQAVFDLFCSDMDASMREMGVADIAVPRKMRAIGEAFYGRKRAYEAALAEPGVAALAGALARNLYGCTGSASAPGAEQLADYVRAAAHSLGEADIAAVRQGQPSFPNPLDAAAREAVATGVR